jgi:hypothetical protein
MMPPQCHICGLENSDDPTNEFEIVYFKESKLDEKWYARQEKEGFEGHPPNAYWFCEKHTKKAKEFAHLTSKEALRKIKPWWKF